MRYTREDGCRAWLANGLINTELLSMLLEEHDGAEGIYDRFMSSGETFLLEAGVSDLSVRTLKKQAQPSAMHKMMLTMKRLQAGVMCVNDPIYPDSLRSIPSPPQILFYRGNPECLMGKCITIIGSRSASPHACDVARKISRELSDAGVTIVSGLAVGIDSEAHRGCLEGSSPTAAVLACGLDLSYPVANLDMRRQICEKGGVLLTEYPLGYQSGKHVFYARNRIMSGLGRAVLMIESRVRSGCMITVQHALDQGREVYAYPGIPQSVWSEGAHQLLREGANYFTSASDILDDMGWNRHAAPVSVQKKELPAMSDTQRRIYSLLNNGDATFDELASKTGLASAEISAALTILEMMGLIKSMPGKTYCRV